MATTTQNPPPTDPASTQAPAQSSVPGESEAHPGPIAPEVENPPNDNNNNQDNNVLEADPEVCILDEDV